MLQHSNDKWQIFILMRLSIPLLWAVNREQHRFSHIHLYTLNICRNGRTRDLSVEMGEQEYVCTQYLCLQVFYHIFNWFFSVGYTDAFDKLVPDRPPGSLVELSNLLSIIIQVILVGLVQLAAFFYLRTQPWLVICFCAFLIQKVGTSVAV